MATVIQRLPAAKQQTEVSVKILKAPYTRSKAAASTSLAHLPKAFPTTWLAYPNIPTVVVIPGGFGEKPLHCPG